MNETQQAEEPTDDSSESQPQAIWKRLLLLVVLIAAGTGAAVYGVAEYYEWQGRRETSRYNAEVAAHLISVEQPPSPKNFFPQERVDKQDIVEGIQVLSSEDAQLALRDMELVIGVTINGESRAYPLNALNGPSREIFNDELGGKAIATTWCNVCNTPMVFARKVDDKTLTLGVSGKLWEGNLIMYDQETGSLWSQLLAESMEGELIGKKLELLPSTLTDWKSWKTKHPETTAAYMERTTTLYNTETFGTEEGLVIGLARGNKSKSWSLGIFGQYVALDDEFDGKPVVVMYHPPSKSMNIYARQFEGEVLNFEQEKDAAEPIIVDKQSKSRWDPLTGVAVSGPHKDKQLQRLPGVVCYGDIWTIFHPGNELVGLPTLAMREPDPLENTEPKKDEPKKDEPKKDEPKKDEPKKDEPKKDEPKKDEPKKDEPKKDEPKKDEPKKDEPKKDEPKKDE